MKRRHIGGCCRVCFCFSQYPWSAPVKKSIAPPPGYSGLGCEIWQYIKKNSLSCARAASCCAGAFVFSCACFETLCPKADRGGPGCCSPPFPVLTFRRSGSVLAVRKEKRMYFDAKEFGKRLHDVRTSRGITQEELAVRLGLASSMSAAWRTVNAAALLTCWLNCPASSMSARIIFWWAASQAKRKSKMIFLVLFRSCLRLRKKSKKH